MDEYKPTYKDRCTDPECPDYGKPLVDRGYGYPVCPSQKWWSERYPGTENKPMHPEFIQKDTSNEVGLSRF